MKKLAQAFKISDVGRKPGATSKPVATSTPADIGWLNDTDLEKVSGAGSKGGATVQI